MSNPISKIGLTGGIGTGKSEVSRILRGFGYFVVDADALSKSIAANDQRAVAAQCAFYIVKMCPLTRKADV